MIDEHALFVEQEEERVLRLNDLHRVLLRTEIRYHINEVSPLFCYSIHEREEVNLEHLDVQHELNEFRVTDRNTNLISIRYDVPLAQ